MWQWQGDYNVLEPLSRKLYLLAIWHMFFPVSRFVCMQCKEVPETYHMFSRGHRYRQNNQRWNDVIYLSR